MILNFTAIITIFRVSHIILYSAYRLTDVLLFDPRLLPYILHYLSLYNIPFVTLFSYFFREQDKGFRSIEGETLYFDMGRR